MEDSIFYNYPLVSLAVIAVIGAIYSIVYHAVKPSPKAAFDQSIADLAESLSLAYKAELDGRNFSLIARLPSLSRLDPKLYSAVKGNYRGLELTHFSLALSSTEEDKKTSFIVIPFDDKTVHSFQLIQQEHYDALSRIFPLESEIHSYKLPEIDGTHLLFSNEKEETTRLINKLFQSQLGPLAKYSIVIENNTLIIFNYEKTLHGSALRKVFSHSVEIHQTLSLSPEENREDTLLALQPDHCLEPNYPYGTEYLRLANELALGYADFWKLERTRFLQDLPLLNQCIHRPPYNDDDHKPGTHLIWGKYQDWPIYLADRPLPYCTDFSFSEAGTRNKLPPYAGSSLDLKKFQTFCVIWHKSKHIPAFELVPKNHMWLYKPVNHQVITFDDEAFSSQYEVRGSQIYAIKEIFDEALRKLLLENPITIECVGEKTSLFTYMKVVAASERKAYLESIMNIFTKIQKTTA